MKHTLLLLEPPDAKHPANTKAVATVQHEFDSGESIIVNEYRVVQPSRPGPMYVAPPARWGADNKRVPIVVTTRKFMRDVEDLILAEYTRRQLAELNAAANLPADSPVDKLQKQQTGGVR